MNKVDAPCRPAASLKFTIDNILNLKTSGRDSCHSAGLKDDSATAMRKDAFQSHHEEHVAQQRQDPGSRLNESGKSVWCFCGCCCLWISYIMRSLLRTTFTIWSYGFMSI